jgi:AcrR family transcriptional regulator
MGVAERKLREKTQREEAILAAAKLVFQQKGLVAATMDDIAAAAELAKGTLYRHYRSKEDIMLLINERALQELHGHFVQATAAAGTGLEKLLRLTQAYYAFGLANPAYFDFIAFFESPFPNTSVATLYATGSTIRTLVMNLGARYAGWLYSDGPEGRVADQYYVGEQLRHYAADREPRGPLERKPGNQSG